MEPRPVDLVKLRETQQLATELLEAYLHGGLTKAEMTQRIQPHEEDWAKVFKPEYVDQAKEGYKDLWDNDVLPEAKPGQSEVKVAGVIPAWMFATDNPASAQHPGGYRRIAAALQPDMSWVSWKFLEPGKQFGMSHNGLVRVDEDRFAWFPKPWRVLDLQDN